MNQQPPGFAVDVQEADGGVRIVPRGELDLATAPELEATLRERLESAARVTLDLRSLHFMDSSGVRTLVTAHRLADTTDGASLRIVRPDPASPVSRVLDIAGIADQLGMVAE